MISTLELYGVEPKKLAEMSYKDALKVMHDGLWNRKKVLADAMFAATNGDEASKVQDDFRKVLKAIELTDLRLEEIR